MYIAHIPLLKIARDLHDVPRGTERFEAYIKTILNHDQTDAALVPLVAMNPMGREHVAARLDEWIALDGDARAADDVREAAAQIDGDGDYQHGLVIMDDVRGGWTNKYSSDAAFRFGERKARAREKWLTTALMVSESASLEVLRAAIRTTLWRAAYRLRNGDAVTLRDVMIQEGQAAAFAGMAYTLEADDLDYTRYVITPYLESDAHPVIMAALYGDVAAHSLGYPPLGLSANAGFALAKADFGQEQHEKRLRSGEDTERPSLW